MLYTGFVSTVAGETGNSGYTDGVGTAAMFNTPMGVVISPNGHQVFVCDAGNNVIRVISTQGSKSNHSMSMFSPLTTSRFLIPFCYINYSICIVIDNCGAQSVAQIAGCVTTPAGYYKPSVLFSGSYYACPAGYYSTTGSTSCSPCPASYYSQPGASVCTGPCPLGTIVSNGACVAVPAGYIFIFCCEVCVYCFIICRIF